jgi:histidine ammonia-lyase
MAAHGARRLGQMVENLEYILGVELLCAAQGIDFRVPLATSQPLQRVLARLREDVAPLGEDRYLAPDLQQARALIASGALTAAAQIEMPDIAL